MNWKRYLLPSALILAVGLALANAQNINKALQLSQDSTGAFGVDANNNIYFPGHVLTTGPGTPVLTACITGGTPTIAGTDFIGTLTAGTTASTSCVVTFNKAFLAAPTCLVAWAAGGPPATTSWTTSTTALTITQASTASSVINWMCSGAK